MIELKLMMFFFLLFSPLQSRYIFKYCSALIVLMLFVNWFLSDDTIWLPPKQIVTQNVFDDRKLDLVVGQRGKHLLVVDGYTFAKNNVSEKTVYWCCRTRIGNRKACRARVTTVLKDNGLHKLTITHPFHNHEPSYRTKKRINKC